MSPKSSSTSTSTSTSTIPPSSDPKQPALSKDTDAPSAKETPAVAQCTVTLKADNPPQNTIEPVLQMTAPHPPPPPPPGGRIAVDAVGSSAHNDNGTSPPPSATLVAHAPTQANTGASTLTGITASLPARPSAPDRLTEKIEYARQAATAEPFYLALGDPVRLSTTWIRDGRANVLVAKAAADSVAEALAAHAADPTAVEAPPMPERVRCTIIGTINNEQAYLRADGNYKGENPALTWQKTFAQTTLSFALGCPPSSYPNLVKDFHAGLATFESVLPNNVNLKSGQYVHGFPTKHLRLRHTVFAPRSEESQDINDGITTAEGASMPSEFSIFQWPTYSPQAADALAAIVHSHVARPLPAYDLRGDLIPPTQYPTALRGATVLLSFNVLHYSISEKRTNGTETMKQQICLDVDYIRVLIPPPRTSPAKRSAVHLTDPHSHAAKKLREY